jgi:hypothetical protein
LALQLAIQNAGSIDGEKVRDALAVLDVVTFYGQIKFNDKGFNSYKPMVTVQIQHGKVVTVWPANVAAASVSVTGWLGYATAAFSVPAASRSAAARPAQLLKT